MAYVIAEPCIGTKDSACVDACPVDCIHPKKDEAGYGEAEQLFIDSVGCMHWGASVPVRPVAAVWVLSEIRGRLRSVRVDDRARWGKMTAKRMVRHLICSYELALGERVVEAREG